MVIVGDKPFYFRLVLLCFSFGCVSVQFRFNGSFNLYVPLLTSNEIVHKVIEWSIHANNAAAARMKKNSLVVQFTHFLIIA